MKKQSNIFAQKKTQKKTEKPWKVLVVDDEEDVHTITQTVLSNFCFQNKKLQFFHAYSAKEAIEIMKKDNSIALILLDVVMEEDDSGLKVVQYIREVLQNHLVRIILRTGQPGSAPQEEVIVNYDINDYKEKTELTSQKLFTTLVTALRCYQTLESLQRGKEGLLLIIESSAELFKLHSLVKLTSGILTQMIPVLNVYNDSMYVQVNGFTAKKERENFEILAGTGQFDIAKLKEQPPIPQDVKNMLKRSMQKQSSVYEEDAFVGYVSLRTGIQHFIYLKPNRSITDADKELLELFLKNIAIAFENIYFDQEIIEVKEKLLGICEEFSDNFKQLKEKI